MRQKKAFTLIELLVVISIIALLLSILMPALTKVKKQAQFVICKTNLHNYGLAGEMFFQENNDKFPESFIWLFDDGLTAGNVIPYTHEWHNADLKPDGTLWPYLEAKETHRCATFLSDALATGCLTGGTCPFPFDPQYGYSMNSYFGYSSEDMVREKNIDLAWLTDYRITKRSKVKRPSEIIFFSEENYKAVNTSNGDLVDRASIGLNNNNLHMRPNGGGFEYLYNNLATYHKVKGNDRASGVANILFVDGHVDSADDDDTYGLGTPKAFRSPLYSKWEEEE